MDNQFFSQFEKSVVMTMLNLWANNLLPITADPDQKLSIEDAAFLLYGLAVCRPGSVETDIEQLHKDILNDGLKPGWHKITPGEDVLAAKVVSIVALILADELGEDRPLSDLDELTIARGFVSTIHKGEKTGGFGRARVKGEEFEQYSLTGDWIRSFVDQYVNSY
jgi:hypothetical protein